MCGKCKVGKYDGTQGTSYQVLEYDHCKLALIRYDF